MSNGYAEQLKRERAERIEQDTYAGPGGVLYWVSNDRPVPMSAFKDAGLEPPDAQELACEEHMDEVLERYREREANRQPSDEELFEMRAAFGEGETVVNVVTGRRIRL